MTQFRSVAEDIQWLRDEWWLGVAESLSDGHLRRGSTTLGLLLIDGLLQRAWHYYGFEGEPVIEGPDVTALALRDGLQLEHAGGLIAGGGREAGGEFAFLGLFRTDNPTTGVLASAESGFRVVQTAISHDASSPRKPGDLDSLVNHRWALSAYLESPGAVRRGISFSRRDIIEYFRRFHQADRYMEPVNQSDREEHERNQIMSELVGLVHANLRDGLYFEILSIGQAVGRSIDLLNLGARIWADEDQERPRAPPANRYESPAQKGSVLVMESLGPIGLANPDAPLLGNLLGIRSLDVPIYRMFRLKHFRTLLTDQTMALVAPQLWDDPFETLLSNAVVIDTGHGGFSRPAKLRKPIYALCWSLNAESDALWRIYSTIIKDPNTMRDTSVDEEGIRVRTTARRLLSALWRASPSDPAQSCFLGAVRYMPQREAVQHVSEIARTMAQPMPSGRVQAESLLFKREPFAHEREARLIYVEHRLGFGREKLFPIAVDANDLFRAITLDPRLSVDDASERRAELRKLGFTGEIVQSHLYQEGQLEIRI